MPWDSQETAAADLTILARIVAKKSLFALKTRKCSRSVHDARFHLEHTSSSCLLSFTFVPKCNRKSDKKVTHTAVATYRRQIYCNNFILIPVKYNT